MKLDRKNMKKSNNEKKGKNKINKPRKIYKHRQIRRGRIYKKNKIYFGSGKKQKGRGVFRKLLKTFAAPILDIIPI